ncbi:DUF1090 domain-containing protein [Pseudomonas donghuensis]|uniref:DUF1090 domain-containing protein n=1 Tax=Pseudomonas donghuensis TaxID=1163398 RepID=A0AAP0XB03_9PSED|nr:DUF1090 domain-containing protein [Pseudomonas donghuensis]KDO00461.2 DUF1090 domain-containing protein [Pseudomonas donghuensis]MCP6690165.1 DUF1090 domain-containing protein [Pseudomonas donghuensis]MDF9896053.1 small-conductance mechanosensitive channel [Pseudomonas vranovensis]
MKTLKTAVFPLVLTVGAVFSTPASADCAHKRAALEYQIVQAQKYGNTYRVAGLKRALSKTNAYCVDHSYLSPITNVEKSVVKLESKLHDKLDDVREAQAKLREAQATGTPKKIAKARRKLQEKQDDLNEIAAELREAQAMAVGS